MPRREQPAGTKGSLRWVQALVNQYPEVLDAAIGGERITWLSPLASDGFAEYWDEDALALLGLELKRRALRDFWPSSGPRWDALGRTAAGVSILVEGKAHELELASSTAAGERSLKRIEAAFAETAAAWGDTVTPAWTEGYYQYANRLAHAYLLNELNGVPTLLVFLHVIGDTQMDGPETREEWEGISARVHEALQVGGRLPTYVRHAYVGVGTGIPIAL